MTFDPARFEAFPVIGILRGFAPDAALAAVAAAAEGGLSCVEVTLNSPDAAATIRAAAERFGDRVNVGAGTVLSREQLDAARGAGATFIVTPTADADLVRRAADAGLAAFPGAATPTEIQAMWAAGATAVKLFPANAFGPDYVKAVLAPLDHVRLLPVGGVGLAEFAAYLDAGACGAGVGSPLFDPGRVRAGDWAWLADETRRWRDAWTIWRDAR